MAFERRLAKRLATGCLSLFLLPFALIGLLMAFQMFQLVTVWWHAQSWTECEAWIDRVEMKVEHSGDGTSYRLEADYHFVYRNVPYTGTRVWIDRMSDGGLFQKRIHRQLQTHHEQKTPFRCFVDPQDPAQSVLYRDFRLIVVVFYLVFIVAFGGVGCGGLFLIMRESQRSRERHSLSLLYPGEPWMWDHGTVSGIFDATPGWVTPFAVAALWNLFCWLIAFAVWNEVETSSLTAGLVSLLPIIGLWLAWRAMIIFLRWRHYGMVQIQVTPWPYRIGDTLQGKILFSGSLPASPQLILDLKVMENVASEDSPKEVFRQTVRIDNVASEIAFQLPARAGLPPSDQMFDLDNRERTAKWTLAVQGSLGKKDFFAEYRLAAFPG